MKGCQRAAVFWTRCCSTHTCFSSLLHAYIPRCVGIFGILSSRCQRVCCPKKRFLWCHIITAIVKMSVYGGAVGKSSGKPSYLEGAVGVWRMCGVPGWCFRNGLLAKVSVVAVTKLCCATGTRAERWQVPENGRHLRGHSPGGKNLDKHRWQQRTAGPETKEDLFECRHSCAFPNIHTFTAFLLPCLETKLLKWVKF